MSETVLFVCQLNMVRSPMAEGIAQKQGFMAQSCGLEPGDVDELMLAVMREVGIDMSAHQPKSLQDFADQTFDRVVAFSHDTKDAAEAVLGPDAPVELWTVPNPSSASYDVRAIMDNYRAIRSVITNRLSRLS
ncbi:hypothetical protein ACFFUB_11600 [Algimonas porphyrae]|nr:hypothetical protein [Algimonas porphyrae]